ncbi:hypothetical protein IHV12_18420 [Fictibacillus sp. 7GRE50]|nr:MULTISPECIES: hypothetical protein [unclassified Fictibacillus]MBH0166898.1 hypothetical protein [Fictibacillus sp. 7GRE50]MBH0173481.1 hypothetical protein [Fictibacillus sp. 23RED33]
MMKINKKFLLGMTIVLFSIFGFADNAGSPKLKETVKVTEILQTSE